jgi:hypothetical protein
MSPAHDEEDQAANPKDHEEQHKGIKRFHTALHTALLL